MGEAKRRKANVLRVTADEDERISWQQIASEKRNVEAERQKALNAVRECEATLQKIEEREDLCREALLSRLESIPARLNGRPLPDYPKVTYDPASVAFLIRAGKAPDDEAPEAEDGKTDAATEDPPAAEPATAAAEE